MWDVSGERLGHAEGESVRGTLPLIKRIDSKYKFRVGEKMRSCYEGKDGWGECEGHENMKMETVQPFVPLF